MSGDCLLFMLGDSDLKIGLVGEGGMLVGAPIVVLGSSVRGVGSDVDDVRSGRTSSIFWIIGEYCVPRLTYCTTFRGGAGVGVGEGSEVVDFLRAVFVVVRGDDDTYRDCCWSLGESEPVLNRG